MEQPDVFPIDPLSAPALEAYLLSKNNRHVLGNLDTQEPLPLPLPLSLPLPLHIPSHIPDGGTVSGAGGFHGAQFRLQMMEASIRGSDQRITTPPSTTATATPVPTTTTERERQELTLAVAEEDRVDRWIRECYAACGAKRTGEVDWGLPSI